MDMRVQHPTRDTISARHVLELTCETGSLQVLRSPVSIQHGISFRMRCAERFLPARVTTHD